ncbi:hypothetical protein MLD38_026367 [Melastoma candidum]|uniref:Uncharacterized protein n=1 Tax=Melastoma candidum TaxID=119954 RepID=A0ACB9NZQ6_9MYRT|nr:hypothetical protein MLD38_026367 [Melastoma candidum]
MNDDNTSFLTDTPPPTKNPINPKIMLSIVIVLFLIVVAVMCFHSYSRWLSERRRRRRRFLLPSSSSDPAAAPATPTPIVGLDISVLESLPAFTFGSRHVHCECAVCLSEFEEGDHGRQLPNCGHSFHMACIDKWFGTNTSCPLCRAPVDRRWKEAVVLTVTEDDVQAMTAGGPAQQSGLSRSSYSSCSCLVGKEEEGDQPAESCPATMEDRCKELEKMGFCFVESKRSENRVVSLKRIWSV